MSIKAVPGAIVAPQFGSVALVSYLPEPLGSFLTKLRFELAGDLGLDSHNPEAHITFLPPRPLFVPVAEAALEIDQKLARVESFLCELGEVRVFPTTNMLYLSIEAGSETVRRLHRVLNAENLFAEERFEFIPHLTLGGPVVRLSECAALDKVERVLDQSGLSRRFIINDLVMLWQPDNQPQLDWNRFRTFSLSEV